MHHKHPPLQRPRLGHYGRTELAFVGSTCARMEATMRRWAERLGPERCLLVTGEHGDSNVARHLRSGRKSMRSARASWWPQDDRLVGSAYELVLVNGNHYPAKRQIVFVDEQKAGTLVRRESELTDIVAVVKVGGGSPVPDWLTRKMDRQGEPPAVLELNEIDALLPRIEEMVTATRPPLRALLLAGGKSERMGRDKSQLTYRNDRPEWARMRDLCAGIGLPLHLSVATPEGAPTTELPLLPDRFLGLGPLGAIATAFLFDPDAAWLVLACDLPLLDEETLRYLVDRRQSHRYATAPRRPDAEWPEPLVAIYEPRVYPRLLQFLGLGYACPRKVLINSDVHVLPLADGRPLTNVNTPEERERVLALFDTPGGGSQQYPG